MDFYPSLKIYILAIILFLSANSEAEELSRRRVTRKKIPLSLFYQVENSEEIPPKHEEILKTRQDWSKNQRHFIQTPARAQFENHGQNRTNHRGRSNNLNNYVSITESTTTSEMHEDVAKTTAKDMILQYLLPPFREDDFGLKMAQKSDVIRKTQVIPNVFRPSHLETKVTYSNDPIIVNGVPLKGKPLRNNVTRGPDSHSFEAQSAKYAFASSVKNGIQDNSMSRFEVRDGLKLNGHYSYSDGFYKRIVYYEADENGYRVVKEESEAIGNGPVENIEGTASVKTVINEALPPITYSIRGRDYLGKK